MSIPAFNFELGPANFEVSVRVLGADHHDVAEWTRNGGAILWATTHEDRPAVTLERAFSLGWNGDESFAVRTCVYREGNVLMVNEAVVEPPHLKTDYRPCHDDDIRDEKLASVERLLAGLLSTLLNSKASTEK